MASVAQTKSRAATGRGVAQVLLVGILATSCTAEGSTAPDPTRGSTPGASTPGLHARPHNPDPRPGEGRCSTRPPSAW